MFMSDNISKAVIDLEADPFIPEIWSVEEHQKGGVLEWDKDAQKEALHLDTDQKNGKWIEGNKLREELKGKPVLNAVVLDYLLSHPQIIPEQWKGKTVYFWGTVYRSQHGGLYVRSLFWFPGGPNWWDVEGWSSSSRFLDLNWHGNDPAALSVS